MSLLGGPAAGVEEDGADLRDGGAPARFRARGERGGRGGDGGGLCLARGGSSCRRRSSAVVRCLGRKERRAKERGEGAEEASGGSYLFAGERRGRGAPGGDAQEHDNVRLGRATAASWCVSSSTPCGRYREESIFAQNPLPAFSNLQEGPFLFCIEITSTVSELIGALKHFQKFCKFLCRFPLSYRGSTKIGG